MDTSATVENGKIPFLPSETLRTQRVEIYLSDLKIRLQQLRIQHDSVIRNSVDIIKEIDEVSSTFRSPSRTGNISISSSGAQQHPKSKDQQKQHVSKIKKIIRDFENVIQPNPNCVTSRKSDSSYANSVTATVKDTETNPSEVSRILQKFERLSECCILHHSLSLFQRAKESLDKIETFFDGTNEMDLTAGHTISSTSLQHQEHISNQPGKVSIPEGGHETAMDFISCCSSNISMDTFHSTEDIPRICVPQQKQELQQKPISKVQSIERGYDGDNDDSESDLLPLAKKRKTN